MNLLRILQVLSALLGITGLIQTAYFGNMAPSLAILAALIVIGAMIALGTLREGSDAWAGFTSVLLTAFCIAIFASSFYFRTDEETGSPQWIVDGEVTYGNTWAVPLFSTVRRVDLVSHDGLHEYAAKASRDGRDYALSFRAGKPARGTFGHDTLMTINASEKIDVGPMLVRRFVEGMERAFSREIGNLPDTDLLDGGRCDSVFLSVKAELSNEAKRLGFTDTTMHITRKFGYSTEADPCLLVNQERDRQYEEKQPQPKFLKK